MVDSKFFGIPFAVSGDKATIPEDTQPSGAISYQQGYGPDYERDPETDPLAKRVPRDETNELYYQITNAMRFLQLYGTPEWYAVDDNGNPVSYPLTARVRYDAGAGMQAWRSLIASNTTTPGANPAHWTLDEPFSFTALEASLAEALAGTSALKLITPRRLASSAQRGAWNYGTAGGTADAITVTLSPAPASITAGMRVCVTTTATNSNVGPTLNVNGLGAATIVSQRGVAIPAASLPVGICEFIWSGSAWVFLGTVVQPLQAPLTLYVRTDGNNANSGLANTAGGAFATLQGAYNAILQRYSANGYPITLQLGTSGTYVGLVHTDWPGRIIVLGDAANRANYIITPSSLAAPATCSFTSKELYWTGVKFQASASGQRLFQTNGGQSVLVSCDWQSAGGAAMLIGESAGRITLTGTHNFAGSTSSIFAALSGSQIFLGDASPFAGVVSGSPSITITATAQTSGLIEVRNGTMSGTVTGTRYSAASNGVINVGGAGANFFPGTVAGSTATGGQYV